jgi:hypothetical protein
MLRRGNSRFWTLSGSNALAKNMANELVEIGLFDPKEGARMGQHPDTWTAEGVKGGLERLKPGARSLSVFG